MHLATATSVHGPIKIPAHLFPAPADIRTYALPAYESSFTAGATLTGVGVSIDNTAGNAGLPHPGNAGLPQPGNGGISIDTTGGNAGLADPGIGRSVASNVLGNLSLPQSGLFHAVLTGGPYLITSDPAFTSRNTFLSSDYYLHNLGYDPQTMVRLGDGLYEQQLVQNQVLELTGKAVLPPYADAQSMVAGLMDAGADLARELNLPLGAGLTAEQIAGLTRDVIIVQTVVVDGQAVLAPVVYLAQGSRQDMNGPLIAAKDINLTNTQTFINSGLIQAENSFVFDGREIDNTFGTLKSGGLMALATLGDVNLTSGRLDAGALSLNAGGNLILDTATSTLTQVSAGASRVTTTLGPQAEIKVAGDALIITGGNFEQHAGNLTVGGNLGMAVGGDWNLGTVQTGEHKVVERPNEYPGLTLNEQMTGFKIGPAKGTADTDLNRAVGSTVRVGGVSGIAVGNNLTAQGAQIDLGGGGTIVAGNTITLGAAKAVSTTHSLGSDSDGSGSYAENIHFMDEKATGTTLNSGDTLNLVAGKDINLIGSSIILEQGTATLAAAGDVNIGAATETHTVDIRERHTSDHGLSTTSEQSSLKGQTTQSIGSLVSADAVTVMSGNDINVVGSVIVGTGDVGLLAGNNVNITTSQDTTNQDSYRQERHSGWMTQGLSVGVGSEQETDAIQSSSVTNNPSMIGSLTGNVAIVANNKVSIEGSQVLAARDIDIIGKSVDITAATDTWKYDEQQTYHFDGLMVGISSPVISMAQSIATLSDAVGKSGDARTKALGAMAAGMSVYNNSDEIGKTAKDIGNMVSSDDANGSAGSNISINISVGASNSRSESTSEGSNAVGSTLAAGGSVNVIATDGDIHVKGSDITAIAGDAVLNAVNGNILLEAAENSYSQHSDSSGTSGSIGVGISLGKGQGKNGLTLNITAAAMQDKADGEGTTWTNTHITAGNAVTLTSGGDTTLKGAVVSGKQVIADVGGSLTIASLQHTDRYDENSEHAGASVSIPLYYGNYAFSANAGAIRINSNYRSVVEQSAIHAGDGGFQDNLDAGVTVTQIFGQQASLTAGAYRRGPCSADGSSSSRAAHCPAADRSWPRLATRRSIRCRSCPDRAGASWSKRFPWTAMAVKKSADGSSRQPWRIRLYHASAVTGAFSRIDCGGDAGGWAGVRGGAGKGAACRCCRAASVALLSDSASGAASIASFLLSRFLAAIASMAAGGAALRNSPPFCVSAIALVLALARATVSAGLAGGLGCSCAGAG